MRADRLGDPRPAGDAADGASGTGAVEAALTRALREWLDLACGGRHTGKRQTPPWRALHHRRGHVPMRHESWVTSLSWIPSEAVTGGTRVAFDAGFTHYDEPP